MTDLQIDERVWQILCNDQLVEHMFDASGSEVFDPTQAVEWCEAQGGLQPLKENDVLTFTLIMDG